MKIDYKKPIIGFLTWNRLGLTAINLNLLLKSTDDFDLIIVDNGSTDGTAEYLKTIKDSRIKEIKLFPYNYGYAYGFNYVISKRAKNQDFINIENDVAIHTLDFISNCQIVLSKFPNIGVLGNTRDTFFEDRDMPYEDLSIDGVVFRKTNGLVGCLMYFPSKTLDTIGYISEELYIGDIEISFRMRLLKKEIGFCLTNKITQNQAPSCSTCSAKKLCANYDSTEKTIPCINVHRRGYKHRKLADIQRPIFKDYTRTATIKTLYCASIHDPESMLLNKYDFEICKKNFLFFKNTDTI